MNRFDSKISLATVLFLTFLLIALGFVYFTDRAHASTSLWDTGEPDYEFGVNTWGGVDRIPSSSITGGWTLNRIDLKLKVPTSGPAQTTDHNWTFNVGYETAGIATSSRSSGIFWNVTSTGAVHSLPSSSLGWYTFDFSPGFYAPDNANIFFKLTHSTTSYLLGIGTKIGIANPNGKFCAGSPLECNGSRDVAYRLYASESTTGNETIAWRFPEDALETQDWSNNIFSLTNLATSTTYYIRTKYTMTATDNASDTLQVNDYFYDWISITGDSNVYTWTQPKSISLTPAPDATRTWDLSASLCLDTACNQFIVGDEISITTYFSSTIPDTPYTSLAGPFHGPDDYLYSYTGRKLTREQVKLFQEGKWCTDPEGWADALGYAFCRVAEILLKPQETDFSVIKDNFNLVKEIYPFKYAWDILDDVKGGSVLPDTSLSPTLILDMSTAFGRENSKITLLSSSTLSGPFGAEETANIKTTERYVIWSVVLGVIIKTLLI